MKAFPVTRAGWAAYYADIYSKTGSRQAEHLAVWYLLLEKAFGERPQAEPIKKEKKSMSAFFTGRA